MGGYTYVLGFLIPLQLLVGKPPSPIHTCLAILYFFPKPYFLQVQLGLRLIVHQIVLYAVRLAFWVAIPRNDKAFHSYHLLHSSLLPSILIIVYYLLTNADMGNIL